MPPWQVSFPRARTRCDIGNDGRVTIKPSAVRRARRLAHGNAVGKRINIPERRRRDTAQPKERTNMSHTYVQDLIHVVFSTKERRKFIPQKARRAI